MTILRTLAATLVALALAGCQTTPTTPPALDLPAPTLAQPPANLERWWTTFGDPVLDRLVDEALAHNLDLAAALARVELARANVLLAQSDLYPSVGLQVGASRNRITEVGSQPLPQGVDPLSSNFSVGLAASYELDLWGKYRASTEAARRTLLATAYARETVRTTVAAEVARAYFSLLAADAELALLRDTVRSRDESVGLQRDRFESGVVGELDLRQAEAERSSVLANIAIVERAIGLYEAALAALAGRSPRDVFTPSVARTDATTRLLAVPTIPEGLPSGLLERRPDVRRVEAELAAASLRIDAARADYFPSVALTGFLGTESAALRSLFSGPALAWSLGAALAQPLIGLKAIEANVEAQRARREETVVAYRQTVQAAFRETHDALVVNRTARAALAAQAERRLALEKALELADLRYRSGYSGYLEVLDAQRQLLQAQTLEIDAARDARNALVDLAKALGGGWTPDAVQAAAAE
ncbi:MAG TPA: efflux transporter outer membrane subunit [Casimicrobiaceae bacterium]|nr:efflux transporter outer membrane subunit [Casimicrobiaceae bacterium]